jgi:SMI1-KNR4 cell-wall
MLSRREIVERELEVKIPRQYAVFLEKHGIYHAPGIEVYGISDSLLHYDGIPCVIGATRNARMREGIPHSFLVIEHTGIEDETICLDTKDGKVYSTSRVFGNRKIADSFDEWFERDIIEFSKRDRPNKYAGETLHPIFDRENID